MSKDTTDSNGVDRRKVLQGTAAGAVAATGASGVASATSGPDHSTSPTQAEIDSMTAEYRDRAAVRQAFAAHDDLLVALRDEGFIESATVDALSVPTELAEKGPDPEGLVFDAQRRGDEYTPEIRMSREVDDGMLVVAVQPEVDDYYAALVDPEAEEAEEIAAGAPEYLCNGCPNNKSCKQECGFCQYGCDPCPSCSCCYCGNFVCRCTDCGWNCLFECP